MKRASTLMVTLLLVLGGTAQAAQDLPFRTSFETGDLSDWFWGNYANTTVINTPDAFDGNYCARIDFSATENWDNYQDYYFGDHVSIGSHTRGEAADELWLKFSVKYDSDTVPTDKQKLALINFTNGTDNQRRYQVMVYSHYGEFTVEHSYIDSWRFFMLLPNVGETPSQVRPGQWDTLKLYMRPNTPGQSDGIVRLWVNGEQKLEYTNINMRESTSYNPNKLIMSSWVDVNRTSQNGVLLQDDYYLGETDPDAGSAVIAPPSPPVLLNN
ncbi:MAG: heparin lyase I family protein [Candidatus Thiodiazotropha sp.]